MICLKIRTFVVSATTCLFCCLYSTRLWFAWKFVPLWYQQQLNLSNCIFGKRCDLLENSYLCGISNNLGARAAYARSVVICLKIRTFVVSATTCNCSPLIAACCDLLENSYLCGISNNFKKSINCRQVVVICLKIRTFVVSATTTIHQHAISYRCDLLENSYLCGISNNDRY